MARLPIPGQDQGTWGEILNDFLSQSHGADGKLASGAVGTDQLQDGAVSASKIPDGTIAITKLESVGTAHGLAEIDADGDVVNANAEKLLSGAAADRSYVMFRQFDGTPVPAGHHVEIRLTADGTDIDDIKVVAA
jgi:hypothetical protein